MVGTTCNEQTLKTAATWFREFVTADTTGKYKGLVHEFVINDSGCFVDSDDGDCRFVDASQIYKRADSIIVHYSGARVADFNAVPTPADGYNLIMAEYAPYVVRSRPTAAGSTAPGASA